VDDQQRPTVALQLPSPVVELHDARIDRAGVRVLVKRDDLIHPELPGNKWRKLKHNLTAATGEGHDTLLTFGGAYSNHVRATAAAGHHFGFRTIGVIRGEEHLPLNPSLAHAVSRGMSLTYLDRGTYRAKDSASVIEGLRGEWGRFYLLPEGGSNALAAQGCTDVPAEVAEPFDVICCPVGTGGTLAGIAAGLGPHQRAIGFSALKGGDFLANEVTRLQEDGFGKTSGNWRMECGFHFGGVAKTTPQLQAFIEDFAGRHGMTLERVYVAKMMFGVLNLIGTGAVPNGTTIVTIVTG
jgi:1-aminocyclopropane-1-carboxylate deaminase